MAKERHLSLTAIAYLNLVNSGEGHLKAVHHAARACAPVAALAMARAELGHWPTQAEYAEHWEISERQAQLEWAAFRRAFPGEQTPERYAKELYSAFAPRLDRSMVMTAPAPRDLQPA
jgi:hypothetical protein